MPEIHSWKERVFHFFLLILLTTIQVTSHLMIYHDLSFINGKDEGWHMQNARLYAEVLWLEPEKHTISELFERTVEYPPVVYLSSLVSQILLRSQSPRAIYFGLVPFFLLLNISLYFLAKKLFDSPETGIWAAILLAVCPVFLTHWGVYNLQVPLMAMVAPLFLALLSCKSYTKLGNVLLFFALLAFGFLIYVWALMLVWLPAVALFFYALWKYRELRFTIIRNVLVGLFLFFILIAPYMAWPKIRDCYSIYLPMINPIVTERAGLFASEGGRFYYLYHLNQVLGLPVLLLFLWGLVRLQWKNKAQAAWALSGVGMLIFLSLFTNIYIERALPFCVIAAVIAAFGLIRTFPFFKRKVYLLVGLVFCLFFAFPSYFWISPERSQLNLRAPLILLQQRCNKADSCRLNVFGWNTYWNMDLFQRTDPSLSSLNHLFDTKKYKEGKPYTHYLQLYDQDDVFLKQIPPVDMQVAMDELEQFRSVKHRLKLIYRENYINDADEPLSVNLWEDPMYFTKTSGGSLSTSSQTVAQDPTFYALE